MQYKSLIASSLLAATVSAETGMLGDAAAINNNPAGKYYEAKFDSDLVKGVLSFVAGPGGKGVDVSVKIEGLAGKPGPFGYHIHDQPVPDSGNCTETKAHLDPYQRGALTPCDATAPQTCEVGDLAGKHGKITGFNVTDAPAIVYSKCYNEQYASTLEGIGAFLGNRSIVIHANDEKKSRLACANIVPVYSSSFKGCSGSGPSSPSGTSTVVEPTGTATATGGSDGYPSCNGKCPYPTGSSTGHPSGSGHPNAPGTDGPGSNGSGANGTVHTPVAPGPSTPAYTPPASESPAVSTKDEEGSAASFGVSSTLAAAVAIFAGLMML